MSQPDTRTITVLMETPELRILRISDQDCGYPTVFKLQQRKSLWVLGWWKTLSVRDTLRPLLCWLIAIKPKDSPGITVRVTYVDLKDVVRSILLTPQHSLISLASGGSYMLFHTNPLAVDCAPSIICYSDECKGFEVFVNGFVAFSV